MKDPDVAIRGERERDIDEEYAIAFFTNNLNYLDNSS